MYLQRRDHVDGAMPSRSDWPLKAICDRPSYTERRGDDVYFLSGSVLKLRIRVALVDHLPLLRCFHRRSNG